MGVYHANTATPNMNAAFPAYAYDMDGYAGMLWAMDGSFPPVKRPKGQEHGITFRRRVALRKWGVESTKRGLAINMGRTVIYVR